MVLACCSGPPPGAAVVESTEVQSALADGDADAVAEPLSGVTEAPATPPRPYKESEKVVLQEIVRDFARAASAGAPVGLIDADTADVSRAVLVLNRALSNLRLRPADAEEWEFYLMDICHIFKGVELERRAPGLHDVAPCCLGIDIQRVGSADSTSAGVHPVFLHFGDVTERDKFYTCLKILRMSAEVSLKRQAASPREVKSPEAAGPSE